MGSSVKFIDFHVRNLTFRELEAQGGADKMEALDAGSSGIYDQHVPLGIAHNLEDMRVAAYEYVRTVFVYQLAGAGIVSARISAHMGHQHLQSLAFEETMEGMYEPELMIVAVARDT